MFSKDYLSQLKEVHADKTRKKGFGGKTKRLGRFHEFVVFWQPKTLLDYGCGKGTILSQLNETYPEIKCDGYDPAVSMFENIPALEYDLVFSNDVLEHIEPIYIDSVLEHIENISKKYVWLRIDTQPARKTLPDGRNAHLIIQGQDWWKQKVSRFIKGEIVYIHLDKKGKLDIAIEK